MPLGVLGSLNLSSPAVSAVIILFWLGIAATFAKVASSLTDITLLASSIEYVP
jgi:hypothetical protein